VTERPLIELQVDQSLVVLDRPERFEPIVTELVTRAHGSLRCESGSHYQSLSVAASRCQQRQT
jgi:hypothetical protein